ncbi:hypothetical protein HRI_003405900 [Hibiscus trionum]|uniref:Uncharacterized protein n=1 Tax=Hibiscus trionum TaxID=183268 RepID=A0A9W7IKU8_HIBTR|nr:hypothetical protein HRI_003405900 [Hibiscus trionum]
MEARKTRKRKNEQLKIADSGDDLAARYRALLAEKINSDARAERAEKRAKELEELVRKKDAELVAAAEGVKKACLEISARVEQAERILANMETVSEEP